MKKKIFVGSSVEGLNIAYSIQESLDFVAEVTVWDQDIFEPSSYTLESLEEALATFDYGIFVFTGDDTILIRDETVMTARDNVLFELGLFIGSLGRKNCFFLHPRNVDKFHIPTDLLGVTPLTYDPKRSDGNLQAALGPACNKIRKIIEDAGTWTLPSRSEYDLPNGRYPTKRISRYLDTACIFPDRTAFDACISYQAIFLKAKTIRGLGISCNAILQNWGQNNVVNIIKKNECRVKLLIMDPDSNFISQRERDESHVPGTIADITKTNIALAKKLRRQLREGYSDYFSYKLYQRPASLNMFIIDRSFIVVQHYIPETRGQETPVFVIQREADDFGVFSLYEGIFEDMWTAFP